jgi:undecaprenyl-diphosphatase
VRKFLPVLSFVTLIIFTYLSYEVARERWTQFDFDTMVKIQDRIPKKFDDNFSIFSLIGSAEFTVGFCVIMALFAVIRFKWFSIVGWFMIVPASLSEVFGKLVLFHPGPPVFFHRTTLATHLPSFYVHTEFSYPSGHMARVAFIVSVLSCIFFFSKYPAFVKFIAIISFFGLLSLMAITRVSLGEHWTSDVLGGLLLGVSFGFFGAWLILLSKKL